MKIFYFLFFTLIFNTSFAESITIESKICKIKPVIIGYYSSLHIDNSTDFSIEPVGTRSLKLHSKELDQQAETSMIIQTATNDITINFKIDCSKNSDDLLDISQL
jgi:hypothetical protein